MNEYKIMIVDDEADILDLLEKALTIEGYYVFSIPEPEGQSLASWPYRFTDNFSIWMENHG